MGTSDREKVRESMGPVGRLERTTRWFMVVVVVAGGGGVGAVGWVDGGGDGDGDGDGKMDG
jgi:hypothetical protein